MRLTKFTDYSLRVLLYAATLEPDQLTTIDGTAEFHGISRAHVTKVVMQLIREGFIAGVRGRGRSYLQRIAVGDDGAGYVEGICSCPVGYDCTHVVAALIV